jgi:hypothetical protein
VERSLLEIDQNRDLSGVFVIDKVRSCLPISDGTYFANASWDPARHAYPHPAPYAADDVCFGDGKAREREAAANAAAGGRGATAADERERAVQGRGHRPADAIAARALAARGEGCATHHTLVGIG